MLGMALAPSAGAVIAPASARATAVAHKVDCSKTACYYKYYNQADDLCLGMPDKASGTQAAQSTCNTDDSQWWKFVGGEDFQLINLHSGLCLAIQNNDPDPGGAVVQHSCSSSVFQMWSDNGTANNAFLFYNDGTEPNCAGLTDACAIHPSGNSPANGAKLYVNTPTSDCQVGQSDCFYDWIRTGTGRASVK
jgi:Ricin-type beta-trefoil lectin domain